MAIETFPVLPDGTFRFFIESEGDQRPCAVDAVLLDLTCQECVDKHRLQLDQASGCYIHTREFLMDLAAMLTTIGVEGCSPSVALALWIGARQALEILKKNVSETPSSLTGSESSPEGTDGPAP